MMLFNRIGKMYLSAMSKRPWSTTIISTGCICGTGDILAQQIVERHGSKHDVRRTIKMTSMGLFFIGPGLRTWYIFLDKLVVGASSAATIKKVALDQFAWAPCFIAAFFCVSDSLDKKSKSQIMETLETAYWPALQTNYLIWPWVQLGNFYFVPLAHRIMVVNFVALFWNMYLAWAAHKTSSHES